jgi:transposase
MFSLDVSKDTLSCALFDPQTRKVLWETCVPNSVPAIAKLLDRVPAERPWVMEPTGRYSLSVAKQAVAAGRQVLLAPPRKAKRFLESIQSRAKTDRLDARGLGQYALAADLAPYPIRSDDMEALHQLLTARTGLSRSLSSLRQQRKELPCAAEPLHAAMTALEAQLKVLDAQIAKATAPLPDAARLDAVPGIGPVTAAAAVACLKSKAFSHPDKFVAYLGFDIAVRQSGRRSGERGLTKEGDAELRRLFFLCAQANRRCKKSPFKAQYERERAKGLSTTAALCAVARKMARVCWSLVAHQEKYNPDRVNQQKQKTPVDTQP